MFNSDLFKLLISKDFVSNAKSIINILNKTKSWKNDIVKFTGSFSSTQRLDADVIIERSLSVLKDKAWDKDEIEDVRFILLELVNNSFAYGLPNKEYSSVNIDIIITTPYIKMSISDNGHFDLKQELLSQNCSIPGDALNKGLSFVYQITPEISQNIEFGYDEIVVIKRKGSKPMIKKTIDGVIVLKVGASQYVNGENYMEFGNWLNEFKNKDYIIVDFGAEEDDFRFASRVIRDTRAELETVMNSGSSVCVCGLGKAPFPIKAYFSKAFHVEDDVDAALDYIHGLK